MRCTFCGTGLARDATRCWLCHAGVDPSAPDDGPADLDFLPHPAHVWTGPLARAPVVHSAPDPVLAPEYSRPRSGVFSFRGEIRILMTLLVVLTAVLPYAATGSRRILLLFGVPFGLMAIWSLKHIWRRARFG
jgi:hypothetical protein